MPFHDAGTADDGGVRVGGLGELTGASGGWKVPACPKPGLATAGVS